MTITSRFGLSCAISTPFSATGDIDVARLVDHAKDRLARGCDSITLFGTTGEGASIGLGARAKVFEAFVKAGIAPRTQLLSTVVAVVDRGSGGAGGDGARRSACAACC